MKKITIILLTAMFVPLGVVWACLNGDSKVLKDGTFLYEDYEGNVPYGHSFYKVDFQHGILRLDSLYKVTNDIDYLSDKALLWILLEKYEDAIKLYLEIEKMQPDRYSTASNIGTAYELTGQYRQALKWIEKAVELDPESHHHSEWIHVNILKAKINGEKSYNTTYLLGIDFGNEDLPAAKVTKDELLKLSQALFYQLNERISFVKPKEKIVAQLLFDLGNISFLLGNFRDASTDYKLAQEYGFSGRLLESRIKESDRLSPVTIENVIPDVLTRNYLLVILVTLLILITIIGVMYKKRRTKN